jgi:hypothetical protein
VGDGACVKRAVFSFTNNGFAPKRLTGHGVNLTGDLAEKAHNMKKFEMPVSCNENSREQSCTLVRVSGGSM